MSDQEEAEDGSIIEYIVFPHTPINLCECRRFDLASKNVHIVYDFTIVCVTVMKSTALIFCD